MANRWTNKGSSWSIAEKYNTPADLVWNWNLEDSKWHVEDQLELKCKLIGTTTNKDKDGQVVTENYLIQVYDQICIRDWLNSGRFTEEDGM